MTPSVSCDILKIRLDDLIGWAISCLKYRPAIWRFVWQNQEINSREITRLHTQRDNIVFALNVVDVSEQRAQLSSQLSSVEEQLVRLVAESMRSITT